jgi:transposase InsO family protein
MRKLGVQGIRRGRKCWTTIADDLLDRSTDKVNRQFVATRPNQLWVADITFVATWTGFVYVAFITDVFARLIVGWRVTRSLHTDWVFDALEGIVGAAGNQWVNPSQRSWQSISVDSLYGTFSRSQCKSACLLRFADCHGFVWAGKEGVIHTQSII